MREDVKEILEKVYIGYVLIGIQQNEHIEVITNNPHDIEGIKALEAFTNTIIQSNSEAHKWERKK